MLILIAVLTFLLVCVTFLPFNMLKVYKLKRRFNFQSVKEGIPLNKSGLVKKISKNVGNLLLFFNLQMSQRQKQNLVEKLTEAALISRWTPMDIYSLQLVLPICISLFYIFLALVNGDPIFYYFALFLSPLSYFLPSIWLTNQVRKRKENISSELPHYINSIAIMCEAGLNLFPAIKEVSERKNGVLSDELNQVLYEVSLGTPQSEALEQMAERCQSDEMSRFVSIVNQTLERGSAGITNILRQQAAEVWERRKKRAQEMGAKASAKLFFPLMLLAFPATIIFILGPVLLEVAKFILS
ncbi:type II secretion system F family protein [Robertmurraya korlensis]|uniref:type II secretion system F family protein n=1 Tax=Robertmurraya korlensis TaxID=519977 RepID=UPI0008241BEB|nr:type II secretion system F family protein [Robertmurraya korlensis]